MSTPRKKLGLATLGFLHYGWGWIEGHSFFLSLCPSINKKKNQSINQSKQFTFHCCHGCAAKFTFSCARHRLHISNIIHVRAIHSVPSPRHYPRVIHFAPYPRHYPRAIHFAPYPRHYTRAVHFAPYPRHLLQLYLDLVTPKSSCAEWSGIHKSSCSPVSVASHPLIPPAPYVAPPNN